jgi:hypothetical protein
MDLSGPGIDVKLNEKKRKVKRIFYHRFFEILKKNRQKKSMGFVLGSPDLEALLL